MFKSVAGLVIAAAAMLAAPAAAQEFPGGETVTIVVPFPPGGVTDVAARVVADGLEKKWGSPVVVENTPGGGGITGTQVVLSRGADGHTLLFQTTTLPGYPVFQKEVPFDPVKDLVPVTLFVEGASALVASQDAPFDTFDELVEYARANPATLNYASTGPGALTMNMESLKQQFGLDIQQVSYKGAAAVYTAVLSGEVQLALPDIGRAAEDAAAGKVKMLGTTGLQRSSLTPDVPTLDELGAKDIRGYWLGLFAPAGTPQEIVDKVQADVAELVRTEEAKKALGNFTFEIIASTPAELGERVQSDIDSWTAIAEKAGFEKL